MADPVITTLRILGTRAYINGARASARAIKEVGSASKETGSGMQLFKGALGGVTGALGIMTSAAKSAVTILGALTLYGAKVGLEFDAQIERAQMGMTTLLGSSKEAKKVVQQVQDFAVKAPMLSVADSVSSAQMLIGAGLKAKEAVPTMKAFSDTLSAMGRRPEDLQRMTYAFMQMMSKGKITAEELRGQLGEIFPASKLLAKGMGISMAELQAKMKEGSVKGMKPIRILLREMEKRFGGATEKSAQTFSGMLNNMKENARVILGQIFQPLFVFMRDKLFPWVNKVAGGIQKWAKGGGTKRLITNITGGFRAQTQGAPVARQRGLGQAGERLQKPQQKGKGFLDKMSFAFGKLAGKVIPELKKQFTLLWDALKPAWPFVQHVLIPFVEGFAFGLYKGIIALIPLIKIFATALGWIGQQVGKYKLDKYFAMLGAVIGFVFGPSKLGIFRLFGKVFELMGGIVGKAVDFLLSKSATINRIGDFFLGLAARLPKIMSTIWKVIKTPFTWLSTKLPGIISGAIGAVVSAITNFGAQVGKALGDAIWNALPGWAKKVLVGGVKIGKKTIGAVSSFVGGKSHTPPGRRQGGIGPIVPRTAIPATKRASGGWTSGLTIVGERGPEIAEFPANTYIHPTPKMPSIPAMNINLTAPIDWKGREVAKAVAEDTSDQKARR